MSISRPDPHLMDVLLPLVNRSAGIAPSLLMLRNFRFESRFHLIDQTNNPLQGKRTVEMIGECIDELTPERAVLQKPPQQWPPGTSGVFQGIEVACGSMSITEPEVCVKHHPAPSAILPVRGIGVVLISLITPDSSVLARPVSIAVEDLGNLVVDELLNIHLGFDILVVSILLHIVLLDKSYYVMKVPFITWITVIQFIVMGCNNHIVRIKIIVCSQVMLVQTLADVVNPQYSPLMNTIAGR